MEAKLRIIVLTKKEDYHARVLEGFLDEQKALRQADSIHIKIIFAQQLDFEVVSNKVKEIIDEQPALVVTIGTLCTQAVAYAFHERKINIPLIFCGVTNLRDTGIDQLLAAGSDVITGVSLGHPSHLTVARTLLWIKPSVKSVLLPYSPFREGGLLTSAAYLIKEYLQSRGVVVQTLALSSLKNPVAMIKEKLSNADVLLALEGCIVDDYHQELLSLCIAHATTYFSSSLAAVKNGAAFGLISNPALVGAEAFRRCLQILNNGAINYRGQITLLKNEGRRMAFNPGAFAGQGLMLSPEKLYLLNNLEVIGNFYSLIDSEEE
ncbi:MAG: transporter substrate binding protein [Candidatus Dependentiae bacterium]|nr:transporter substrate binding protein [Candidatus Dependentiae bacterium]